VQIRLNEADTAVFRKKVDAVTYRGGGTNILAALNTAITEINSYAVHDLTLVCEYQYVTT
jgi:uncharacterized protein with von Willebrand factor type A (vWA) domain